MKRDKISNEKIIKILRASYGIILTASKTLRIDRGTLQDWINSDDDLKTALAEIREGDLKDLIEDALITNIKAGKEASIIFASKTQLRTRGYQERLEITDKSKIQDQITTASEDELLEIIANAQKRIKDAS